MGTATDLIQKVSKSVVDSGSTIAGEATDFIRKHPVTSAVTVGGGVLAATQAIRIVKKKKSTKAAKKSSTKKSTGKRKITHTKRGWKQDRARRSKQKWEVAYQKRKKKLAKSKKNKKKPGIYKTKTGQPYKILANGKARFIKRRKK